jgi:hypothetical protein
VRLRCETEGMRDEVAVAARDAQILARPAFLENASASQTHNHLSLSITIDVVARSEEKHHTPRPGVHSVEVVCDGALRTPQADILE